MILSALPGISAVTCRRPHLGAGRPSEPSQRRIKILQCRSVLREYWPHRKIEGKLERQLKTDRNELQAAEASRDSFRDWKHDLDSLMAALKRGGSELRLRMREHLRELIAKIEVFSKGHAHPWDAETRSGDDIVETLEALGDEYFPGEASTKRFRAFAGYVLRRRMSKEGRFLRIHFATTSRMDAVPAGSLATGMRSTGKQKLDSLCPQKSRICGTDFSNMGLSSPRVPKSRRGGQSRFGSISPVVNTRCNQPSVSRDTLCHRREKPATRFPPGEHLPGRRCYTSAEAFRELRFGSWPGYPLFDLSS